MCVCVCVCVCGSFFHLVIFYEIYRYLMIMELVEPEISFVTLFGSSNDWWKETGCPIINSEVKIIIFNI